jgi:putative acetyltransferase
MRSRDFDIRLDDLSHPATRALIRLHLSGMSAEVPPEHVSAFDPSAMKAAGLTVWSAWRGQAILGIGALHQLDATTGEVKSMRTHPDHLRQGVAAAILERIIAEARARGLRRLSLETGRAPAFDPSLALYRKRGFIDGGAFGDHRPSPFNQFLHLAL